MDIAEILSIIVERACSYVPDVAVSESKAHFSAKVPKGALTKGQVPNEEPTRVEAVPNETLLEVVKVPMVAYSNLVSFK